MGVGNSFFSGLATSSKQHNFLKIPPLPPFKRLICIIVFYKCLLVRFAAVFLLFFKCMQIVDYVYYVYHPCQHVMTVSDNYIRGRCIMRPLLVYSNYCWLVSSTAEFFSINFFIFCINIRYAVWCPQQHLRFNIEEHCRCKYRPLILLNLCWMTVSWLMKSWHLEEYSMMKSWQLWSW